MTGRRAIELNEAERDEVLNAVDMLLRAEKNTGISPEELVLIIANHRASRSREPQRMPVRRMTFPGSMNRLSSDKEKTA